MTYEKLAEQVSRMQDLPGYPQTPQGLKELVHALWNWASDVEHAQRIVTRSLEINRFAATPADLVKIAQDLDAGDPDYTREWNPEKFVEQTPECQACGDIGHVEASDGVRRERCSCKYGQELSNEVLEALNRHCSVQARRQPSRPAPKPNVVLRNPITSADVDRAAAEYRAKERAQ